MIKITVELVSAVHPTRSRVLARALITNDATGSKTRGNYNVALLDRRGSAYRTGRVERHPRLALSIWRLVLRALREVIHDDHVKEFTKENT